MAKCLPNKWEFRSTRRKAGLSSERKARKHFWKGWLYVLICPTRKIRQRRSEFSPWVKSCVEWKSEKGKGVNSRTNKKVNDDWHTCTQVPLLHGTTGLNKGFEKVGLKCICGWKALNLGSWNMQFQQDWPKDYKNYSSLIFYKKI